MIFPRNILIVRTDRIGDVVLSLPLAELIKKAYPECRVTFLLREYTKPLAEGNPFIDEVIVLKEEDGKILFADNVRMLQQKNFDTSITVYPTLLTALIIYSSNIKNRIGTGYRWYSLLFNYKIFKHRKYAERHELEFNVNMLKLLNIEEEVNKENVNFNVTAVAADIENVKKVLELRGADLDKKIIIVHPGSGGSAVDLPLQRFKELVSKLTTLNCNIILTGSGKEKAICEELISGINKTGTSSATESVTRDEQQTASPNVTTVAAGAIANDAPVAGMGGAKVINLAGQFDLYEMKALISLCDIFIANSTGPLHIAAAMKKYVIAFYPKITACSVERWGPYTSKSVIFKPTIDCTECSREQCLRLDCMNTIDVNDVFTETEKIFKLAVK